MIGAKSAGMGSTGRAAVEAVESLYLNPASIALMRDFHLGTSYQTGFLGKDLSRNTYSFTATDASPGVLFPASFGYRMHSLNMAGQSAEEQEFRLATGLRLGKRLSVGLGGSYITSDVGGGRVFRQGNLHAGVLFALMSNWGFSLTADGLLDASDKSRPEALDRPRQWALGTQYLMGRMLRFRWEALAPLEAAQRWDFAHHVGVGVLMQSNFSLNLGYSVDDLLGQNWGSAGLAWEGPRLKIAYSFQRESRQELGTRHLVDLWLDI